MDRDDPEQRIADLERQLAEQRRIAAPGITPEQVHNVAFSEASRGQQQDSTRTRLTRFSAALRQRCEIRRQGVLLPADLHNVAFSKPPIGRAGFQRTRGRRVSGPREDRIDPPQEQGQVPATGPGAESVVCSIPTVAGTRRRRSSRSTWTGMRSGSEYLKSNALMASVSLAEVTARPAQHGGGPVVVVDGPGSKARPSRRTRNRVNGASGPSPRSRNTLLSKRTGSCLWRNSVWPRGWSMSSPRRPPTTTLSASSQEGADHTPQLGGRLWRLERRFSWSDAFSGVLCSS